MTDPVRHRWDLTPSEAVQLQRELAGQVISCPLPPTWSTVAALDVSYDRGDACHYAAAVLWDRHRREVVESSTSQMHVSFPYVSGLFSFREAPALIRAIEQLSTRPDLLLCDGQGIAHPRRLGLAAHLGLWLDLPSLGCAKTRLCGTYSEPGTQRGEQSPLWLGDDQVGTVLRTRSRVKPVFISPGHRCDLAGAVEVILATVSRYRLPDPARLAHQICNDRRKANPTER